MKSFLKKSTSLLLLTKDPFQGEMSLSGEKTI